MLSGCCCRHQLASAGAGENANTEHDCFRALDKPLVGQFVAHECVGKHSWLENVDHMASIKEGEPAHACLDYKRHEWSLGLKNTFPASRERHTYKLTDVNIYFGNIKMYYFPAGD